MCAQREEVLQSGIGCFLSFVHGRKKSCQNGVQPGDTRGFFKGFRDCDDQGIVKDQVCVLSPCI